MPREREYTGVSINRIDALNQNLVNDHQRIQKNIQLLDSVILADPSRINDSDVLNATSVTRAQEAANLEKAKNFSNEHFHELADIALTEAVKAGKTIIDARDFDEGRSYETDYYDVPLVPGMQSIVEARQAIAHQYCKENGIEQHDLTAEDISRIHSLPEWQDPFKEQ